jgi:hypothetical protein
MNPPHRQSRLLRSRPARSQRLHPDLLLAPSPRTPRTRGRPLPKPDRAALPRRRRRPRAHDLGAVQIHLPDSASTRAPRARRARWRSPCEPRAAAISRAAHPIRPPCPAPAMPFLRRLEGPAVLKPPQIPPVWRMCWMVAQSQLSAGGPSPGAGWSRDLPPGDELNSDPRRSVSTCQCQPDRHGDSALWQDRPSRRRSLQPRWPSELVAGAPAELSESPSESLRAQPNRRDRTGLGGGHCSRRVGFRVCFSD